LAFVDSGKRLWVNLDQLWCNPVRY